MVWYNYPSMLAIDVNGDVLRSGVGQLFGELDTAAATPLAITDLNGLNMTEVRINDVGLTQAFRLQAPEAVWRSGPFIVPVSSPKGMREASEAAQLAAQTSASSATSSAASAVAAAALVSAPADAVIATTINNPSSAARGAVNTAAQTIVTAALSGYTPTGGGAVTTADITDATALSRLLIKDATAAAMQARLGVGADINAVHLAGAETVTGVKTFTAKPVVPADTWPLTATVGLVDGLAAKVDASGYILYGYVRALGDNTIPANPIAGMLLLNRTT